MGNKISLGGFEKLQHILKNLESYTHVLHTCSARLCTCPGKAQEGSSILILADIEVLHK